jgi:hypothetical protein
MHCIKLKKNIDMDLIGFYKKPKKPFNPSVDSERLLLKQI